MLTPRLRMMLNFANGELVGTDDCFSEMVVPFLALCHFAMTDSSHCQYCFIYMRSQHRGKLHLPWSCTSGQVTNPDAFVTPV
jgi:hypothetical protein